MTDRALTTPPRDLKGGRETEPALLVSIASTRLRDLGVDIPEQVIEQPQQRLYDADAMLDRGLIESARARDLFAAIEDELHRFPAIDPVALRERVDLALPD